MKKCFLKCMMLLFAYNTFGQIPSKLNLPELNEEATFELTYPIKAGKYLKQFEVNPPMYEFKGFGFDGDILCLYNTAYREGLVAMKSKLIGISVGNGLSMCPTVTVFKYNPYSKKSETSINPIYLGDYIGTNEPMQYSITGGKYFTDDLGGSDTDPRALQLAKEYPMVASAPTYLKSDVKGDKKMHVKAELSKDLYNVAMVREPWIQISHLKVTELSADDLMPKFESTTEQFAVKPNYAPLKYTIWDATFDSVSKTGLAVFAVRKGDPKYKFSEYNMFHFVLYNIKGEILNDVSKNFEFIKGVDYIQPVLNIDTKKNEGFIVVLNSNPVLNMGKYKDVQKDKLNFMYFDAQGKLVYDSEAVPAEKMLVSEILAYKKGDDVFLLSRYGNFSAFKLIVSQLNATGCVLEKQVTSNLIGDKGSRLGTTSSKSNSFQIIGIKYSGEKMFIYGDLINIVTVQSPTPSSNGTTQSQKVTKYISFNVLEVDLATNQIVTEYASAKPSMLQDEITNIDDIIETPLGITFIAKSNKGARTSAKIQLRDNTQFADLVSFDGNSLFYPYTIQLANNNITKSFPADLNFRSVYHTKSYLMKDDKVFLIGFIDEATPGKMVYKILSQKVK